MVEAQACRWDLFPLPATLPTCRTDDGSSHPTGPRRQIDQGKPRSRLSGVQQQKEVRAAVGVGERGLTQVVGTIAERRINASRGRRAISVQKCPGNCMHETVYPARVYKYFPFMPSLPSGIGGAIPR